VDAERVRLQLNRVLAGSVGAATFEYFNADGVFRQLHGPASESMLPTKRRNVPRRWDV